MSHNLGIIEFLFRHNIGTILVQSRYISGVTYLEEADCDSLGHLQEAAEARNASLPNVCSELKSTTI